MMDEWRAQIKAKKEGQKYFKDLFTGEELRLNGVERMHIIADRGIKALVLPLCWGPETKKDPEKQMELELDYERLTGPGSKCLYARRMAAMQVFHGKQITVDNPEIRVLAMCFSKEKRFEAMKDKMEKEKNWTYANQKPDLR